MCSAESFLYHPIFRLQFNQGNICIPELWKLQSFLSENKETALVIHSSTPTPLNTLSGCSLLCEKKIYRLRRIAVCYSVIITITLLSIFGGHCSGNNSNHSTSIISLSVYFSQSYCFCTSKQIFLRIFINPNISPFHKIFMQQVILNRIQRVFHFHFFVLAGSACHMVAVWLIL